MYSCEYDRFGLLPFRSPLLREWNFILYSSTYWNVLLQWVCSWSIKDLGHAGLPHGVSPFGNLRIIGCYAPPRSVSSLRYVLRRLLMSRHPPFALNTNHPNTDLFHTNNWIIVWTFCVSQQPYGIGKFSGGSFESRTVLYKAFGFIKISWVTCNDFSVFRL